MQKIFWSVFSFFLLMPSAFAATPASTKPSIAIIDFQNKGGVSIENASIVSNRIRAHLSQSGQYRVLERQQIQAVLKEQGFQWGQNCGSDNCSETLGRVDS